MTIPLGHAIQLSLILRTAVPGLAMQLHENNSSRLDCGSSSENKRSVARGELLLLLLFVPIAFLFRYVSIPPYQVIAGDGPSYVSISRQIFEQFSFTGSIHYPPFYPILIGLANLLLHDHEAAGMAVSLVMGSLLPLPVYLLGRDMFSRWAGGVAAAITLVWSEFVFQSSTVLAYSTYFTLLMSGMYLLWLAHTRCRLLPAAGSGLLFAAAYLSRQEAFISLSAVCCCLAGSTLVRERSVARLKPLLVAYGVFFAVALPYIIMVHQVMGIWTMAGKSVVTLTDCLGYYLERPDLNRDPSFAKIGIVEIIRRYPGYIPYSLRVNLAELRAVLPLPLVFAAVVGFVVGKRGESGNAARWFILGGLFPVVILLAIFLISSAYIAPYLPVLFILCGHGMVATERAVREKLSKRETGGGRVPWVTCAIAGWYVLSSAPHAVPWKKPPPYYMEMDQGRYGQKIAGLVLKKYLLPGATIMTRSGRIGFYSGHPRVDIPQADLPTILATARENKVRYLVVEGMLTRLRPQLGKLLDPVRGGDVKGVQIYPQPEEVLPGLVLRLVYTDYQIDAVAVYEFVR